MVALSCTAAPAILLLESKPSNSIGSCSSSSAAVSAPPLLQWNPLCVHRGFAGLAGRRRLIPLRQHSSKRMTVQLPFKLSRLSLSLSSAAEELGGLLDCGFFNSVIEALCHWPEKPAAVSAFLLGLLFTLANPCDVALADQGRWSVPFSSSLSSQCYFGSHVCAGAAADDYPIRSSGQVNSDYVFTMPVSFKLFSMFAWIAARDRSNRKLAVCSLGTNSSLTEDLSWISKTSSLSKLDESTELITYAFTLETHSKDKLKSPGSSLLRERRSDFVLNWKIHISMIKKIQECSIDNRCRYLTNAVATIEPRCLILTNDSDEADNKSRLIYNSEPLEVENLNDESLEIDDREKLRRIRISKANKGNVPWNKGRKHSAETIQRIRERTRLAMQDPKVKMKLVNLGHAQSEKTRLKISAGVREGWQRRREKLMIQERCLLEWQNSVAELARKGYAGEDQLQWNSYQILGDRLKLEWLESIERRKTMGRPKGSKRAPKSPEQRRKISESISAKWADPEYRDRVRSALAKYHGTPAGGEKRERKKPTVQASPKRDLVQKEVTNSNSFSHDVQNFKKVISKRKKKSAPLYKDPLASSKLEMIKKIRDERAALEAKKREAAERAKLLIAEAEKAANALEMAALKSPLAQASLLETRKLIAEATRSIQNIESGQLTTLETAERTSLDSGPYSQLDGNPAMAGRDILFKESYVNGIGYFSSSNYVDFEKSALEAALNGRESLTAIRCTEHSGEAISDHTLPFLVEKIGNQPGVTDNQVSQYLDTGPIRCENFRSQNEEVEMSDVNNRVSPTTSSMKTKKKWIRGRLIEVEEDSL